MRSWSIDQRRAIWGSATGLFIGAVSFFLILFNFRFDPERTAVPQGFASNFFDIQARALLMGHLRVPTGSLGIEGFVVGGNTYMYFPPFPALLRIPVMLVTKEFDGKLTLLSMALAWVVFATMTVRLYWLIRQRLGIPQQVSRLAATCAGIFIAAATGGTVLTFDAALPWVYHEAYLWAVALVVGTMYWLLRVCFNPSNTAIAWLGGFATATIMTRTTGGIAMCLVIAGTAAWLYLRRPDVERKFAFRIAACAIVPLSLSVAYNAAKFGQPFMFPLQSQVWTSVSPHRRFALEANGGTLTGLQFFWTSFVNYLNPAGIRFVDFFPWITLPATPARAYAGAIVDQTYRTGSIVAFMPLLVILSCCALPTIFRPRKSPGRTSLRAPVIGGVLVTGGIMIYGYLAHRYTSEFVPALVVAGAIGMNVIATTLQRRRSAIVIPAVAAMAVAAAFSLAAQMATGSMAAAQTARGGALVDYLTLQHALSGGPGSPVARLVTQSDALPVGGQADQLHIKGDCDALYLNTGDRYEPWILVAARDSVVTVRGARRVHAARVPLFTITTTRVHTVSMETNGDHEARLVLQSAGSEPSYGFWFPFLPGDRVNIGLRTLPDYGLVQVESVPGGFAGFLPSAEWDAQWVARPGTITPSVVTADYLVHAGVGVRYHQGFPIPLCEKLLADMNASR